MLYFENLSGVKEDEYLRDGITEDILTDLSKIKGLNVFPRTTVLAFRDQKATAADVCRQLRADYALEGSLRRAGNRLRISAQLVDAATGFPVWSERYDREMSDIFEVQDEIAHKIAEALRIKLTPQEQAELAAKPTENLQAYDLYLRGRSYARRRTTRDMEFALQMFENAVTLDPNFALAWAAIANGCAHAQYWSGPGRDVHGARPVGVAAGGGSRARHPRGPRLAGLDPLCRRPVRRRRAADPRRDLAQAGLRGGVLPPAAGALRRPASTRRWPRSPRRRSRRAGSDYNVYIPIMNALGALGKADAKRDVRLRLLQALENHLREVPEDARARILLAGMYAQEGRTEDADPRGESGDGAAAERGHRALQRRLHLLRISASAPRRSTRCGRPGRPASRTPTGRAATPTSRASTATRSSRGSIPRRRTGT